MKRWLSLLLAVLVAATMLSACTDDDASDSQSSTGDAATVPALAKAWSTPVEPLDVDRDPLVGDGVVVLDSDGQISGIDQATGRLLWERRLRGVCNVAEEVHDGLLVVSRRKRRDACNELLAVEVSTGEVRWRRDVPDGVGSDLPEWRRYIAVGERAVSTRPDVCGGVRRFRLRDGKPLGEISPVERDAIDCDEFALAGHWIAQLESTDTGVGNHLTLFDADTGKVAFRRAADGIDLHQIHSVDPLVMELSVRGHRLLWSVDPETGELGAPTGAQWQADSRDRFPMGERNGTLVVGENRAAAYRPGTAGMSGYSLDGSTLWRDFPQRGAYAGDDGRGAVVVVDDLPAEIADGLPEHARLVVRHDWADVDRRVVLGTVGWGPRYLGVAGDLLLVGGDGEVSAYRLPAEAPETELDLPEGAIPLGSEPPLAWAENEVRPGEVADCPISDETLTSLGFHRLALPGPDDCTWLERQEPVNLTRELSVSTDVAEPSPFEEMTATEVAQRRMKDRRRALRSDRLDTGRSTRVIELDGVGDEAYLTQTSGVGGRHGVVDLAVRVRNVVVSVTMSGAVRFGEPSGLVAPHAFEAGAWAALEETLAGAGLSVEKPAPRVRRTPALRKGTDLCAAVEAQVAVLVPESRPQRQAPDPERVVGCTWAPQPGDHDGVQVGIQATPDSTLTGVAGERLARDGLAGMLRVERRYADYGERGPARVEGLGDEAWVSSGDGWLYRSQEASITWKRATVLVRRGNVTVAVLLQLKNVDEAGMRDRAIAIARAVLATQPRS
ncbi:PQQ-binding-like beta-propeller repeat protein [Nocardioides daejeonensis]|uniref:outer membrane protein assembly factor BamB family protein n=1 Tax=Nocardioides daejeonensis TaxID=1046556 RepID=UPI000D74F61F|nr:PQQ-binding-like beta-propeller repeat protein [Nocardioides daejeonensis]